MLLKKRFFLVSYIGCLLYFSLPAIGGEQRQPICTAGTDKDASSQAECTRTMAAILPSAPELDQLRQLFRKNRHFSGTAHNIIPHWNADVDDIKAVRQVMRPSDMPFIGHLLASGDMSPSLQSIAIGVLTLIGDPAIPCIDAALAS